MHRAVAAIDFGDCSARFANENNSGADIPGIKAALPIGVKSA